MTALLEITGAGLYCGAGGFFVDSWKPVDRAVITHGHSDHARPGSASYLTSQSGVGVLRRRLPSGASIEGVAYDAPVRMAGGVTVTLLPAGHVLGSLQVRIERGGEVWCVSGDYKTEPDPTCAAFEFVRCHTFLTESTFGLPIYRWRPGPEVLADVDTWWRRNRERGRTSVLLMRRLGEVSTGFAPGWMQVRGTRRRRSVDRGFVLSDHADWPGLLETVRATGAERVLVTHGYATALARRLAELGLEMGVVPARFVGETPDAVRGDAAADSGDAEPDGGDARGGRGA